ncbi:MAG: carbohydrate kinase family protein [Lachnospiraceae bacterium]|nr:carbohydrate kinase family protein [Lachnospiraceae bacterium]
MNRKFDVVCIGNIVQDIVITGIAQDALSRDTTKGETALVTCGGDADNESVTLARLGSKTALLVKIGNDSIGNSIYASLEHEPIDRSLIIRDSAAEMMMAIVVIKEDGERSFLVKQGNSACELTANDITDEILKSTRAITIGSLFCLPLLDGEGIADVLRRAQSFGTVTICDMTYDINHIGPEAMLCVYPHVDYMVPSLEEAAYATGETDPDKIADFFLARGVKNVVLKLGGDGCFFKNASERFFTDAYEVTPVDTTGCGDNFLGGFTHGLLQGWPLKECTDFACATGSLNATGIGAHLVLKDEAHVRTFMKETPRKHLER